MQSVLESSAAEHAAADTDTVFEELPCAVLVFDEDLRLLNFNRLAFGLMDQGAPEVLNLLAGDVLGCVHASEGAGCGTTPSCRECVLRNTAETVMRTGRRRSAIVPMTLVRDDCTVHAKFIMAASRLVNQGAPLVVVTLQDLSDLTATTR